MEQPLPLRSFWMGGFEGADHRNQRGTALDMVRITGHEALLEADLERCVRLGLRTVRESIGRRLAEPRPGVYNFARLRAVADAARRQGVQVLWTLMHYGMPDDLHVLHPEFVGTEKRLKWHLKDPRRKPFGDLVFAAWERYRQPMVVAETSHVGVGRAAWLGEIATEVQRVRSLGVPLHGICLYPIVDRPGWDALDHWHNSGLWDAAVPGRPVQPTNRVLCRPYARALLRWQRRMAQAADAPSNTHREQPMTSPLVVFSHLRWDFVYQRPQHLLSRIAHQHRVIFIEEPAFVPGAAPHFEYRNPCDNVLVLRPISPVEAPGFHDDQLPVLKPLLQQLLQDEELEDYLVWFYTPMALPLLAELEPEGVIYDCMDELSAFKGAPKQMRQRETALLKRADLVLTGGPSLYQNKRALHPNVHCLPSSVDAAHYAPERITLHHEEYLAAEALQGHILAPRIGFFGVIDERLDLGLVAALADARPDWHIVMVGPVVKIAPEALPQRDNLHWLGQQSYARLPALVAGWDVCMLPFALNEHTRYISPTKTLEYLAAEKPVVSTPVNDVVSMYGDVVRIAHTAAEFVEACEAALQETPQQRAERLVASAATVSRFSWDESARTVLRLMDEAVRRRHASPAVGLPDSMPPQGQPLRVAAAGGAA
jgi:glycosyltransferase involved in cell wall biosynthesis